VIIVRPRRYMLSHGGTIQTSLRIRGVLWCVLAITSMQCDEGIDTSTLPEPVVSEDYCPLALGNRWMFSYEFFSRPTAGEALKKVGTSEWVIDYRTPYADRLEYHVHRTDTGTASFINSYDPARDRVYRFTDTSSFRIVEDKNDYVTLLIGGWRFETPRFMPVGSGDTVKYSVGGGLRSQTSAFVKNVGPVYISWSSGANIITAETFRLLSHSLHVEQ